MEIGIAALVLLAAALHAGWNAVVKTAGDRVAAMALVMGTGAAAAAMALPFVPVPAAASWPFLLLSAAIHIGYFFFLLQAYRVGDLSHVYPVARGAAPLLVAGGAALLAGESLAAGALVGLVLASAAIASFAFDGGAVRLRDPRPFAFALMTALFIGSYTLTDGLGVRASGAPHGFIAWLLAIDGLPLILYCAAARRGRLGAALRPRWRRGVAGGVMCAGAYALVIWALESAPMAHVSALRETSVVFAVAIGSLLLGEPFGRRRLGAAALTAAGIAIMHAAG